MTSNRGMVLGLLFVTGCGATHSASGQAGVGAADDTADDALVTFDATMPDGGDDANPGFGLPGPDASVPPFWPISDASCAPPPPDAAAAPVAADGGSMTVTSAPDGGTVYQIATDDAAVYWTDAVSAVWSAPLAGGPARIVAATGSPEPWDIAVDDAYVFWVSRGAQRVLRCPKTASDCTPFVVLAPFPVGRIALDADNVYATDGDRVLSCPKTGCRNAPTVIASGLGKPYDMVVRGGSVYLLAYVPVPAGGIPPSVEVLKCPVTGCGNAPTALASDLDPTGLAVDDQYVYWTSQAAQADQPGAIERCAICGCGGKPEVLLPASAGVSSFAVAVDGPRIFFVDDTFRPAARLLTCPADGCVGAPTELLGGLDFPTGPLVAGGRLIVTTGSQILSVAE